MSYDIRQSQIIHTWPSGSMIDFPELSLIMLCHDDGYGDWGNVNQEDPNKKQVIRDSRLAEAFKVDHFVVPPQEDGINNLSAYGIRFPGAQYCPKCGLIHFITKTRGQAIIERGSFDQKMRAFTCDACTNNQTGIGPNLVPMRFVIATEEGFLGDFPWDWFVHKSCPKERGQRHLLYYKSKGGSAGLSDITIESYRRGSNTFLASRDLGQIFDQSIFTETDAEGNYLDYVNNYLPKPWKGWHNNESYVTELVSDVPRQGNIMDGDDLSPAAKRKFPRTMQRGAGNIIFPIIYSGILLPQSAYEQQCPPEVQQNLDSTVTIFRDSMPDIYQDYTNEQWRDFLIRLVESNPNHQLLKLGYTKEAVIGFIRNHFGEKPEERFINKAVLLRQQEFSAFTGTVIKDKTVWFKKKKVDGNEYNSLTGQPDLLEEVVLLEKLSALKVYKGFTRVKPLMGEELVFAEAADNLDTKQKHEFERIQDARRDPLHTRELPAVEVKGEGIFLKFSNKKLNAWADEYPNARLDTINHNLEQANLSFNQNHELINKRYLFLHTLSHILLKELAEDCGYSLSSLAEIIYCSGNSSIGTEEEMNGILIYTTTSDAEGSLGGLVEKGQPDYLSSVMNKGVDKARWCSSDPLCISAEQGQGFMGLNLAACYSCVLLPETSCEKMNKYLDRAAVIGTLNNSRIGLFNQ
ncbi:DUF1998 domain-containing protein [Aridibaculum aurantiacum]|uniref:DUF1998 domain-containing protein n=1 Tax=Aridibaculum aurantiacum TaxID=2810307 RepID=UPI001A973100|nr:DUF1998 domain-containing protein [Aridibaculum aurantiacum]